MQEHLLAKAVELLLVFGLVADDELVDRADLAAQADRLWNHPFGVFHQLL